MSQLDGNVRRTNKSKPVLLSLAYLLASVSIPVDEATDGHKRPPVAPRLSVNEGPAGNVRATIRPKACDLASHEVIFISGCQRTIGPGDRKDMPSRARGIGSHRPRPCPTRLEPYSIYFIISVNNIILNTHWRGRPRSISPGRRDQPACADSTR